MLTVLDASFGPLLRSLVNIVPLFHVVIWFRGHRLRGAVLRCSARCIVPGEAGVQCAACAGVACAAGDRHSCADGHTGAALYGWLAAGTHSLSRKTFHDLPTDSAAHQ